MALTPQEQLRRWMKNAGLKHFEAAALIGFDPSVFTKYLLGRRIPGRDAAVKIKRVTGIQIEAWASSGVDETETASGTHGRK